MAIKFTIYDVGHGFCAYLVAETGNVMVWDCGHKSDPDYRPSDFLPAAGCNGIEEFYVTNYDEDHISDLPRLRKRLHIQTLVRNPSISPSDLRALKLESGPISPAMEELLRMLESFTGPVTNPPDFGDVRVRRYWNNYPDFTDTNNLSVVSFVKCRGNCFVIPGDIETAGWKKLLAQPGFTDELGAVTTFIASHHGRESGYCSDVFRYCHPNVIVFSDSPIKYATQQMADTYGQHASGITFNGQNRNVLTTRQDGTLDWNI